MKPSPSRVWPGAALLTCALCAQPEAALGQDAADAQVVEGDVRSSSLVTLDSHHPWSAPASVEDWEKRSARVRRQILVAAGLWPSPPARNLRPLVHGLVERPGYTVERVRLESLPGFYVTGSLYRPSAPRKGPLPAVLSPHGHDINGRFTVHSEEDGRKKIKRGQDEHLPNARRKHQARCVQLARMGCIVFHYDMIGYSDSKQLDHRHGFGDVQAELWGMSHFGLQTLDSLRALDFLLSLPDVDPERVGVTGASGGGTQTFILGAIDDRPAVLFPAVMVSTRMQGGCICENASGLRVGSGNVEFAALAAPRPLGMTAANDWTLQILEDGLPQLRELYALVADPDLVQAWCYPEFPHNFNRVSRGHMYTWMNDHLQLGLGTPNSEPPIVPLTVEEMTVFTPEHPQPESSTDLAGVRASLLAHAKGEVEELQKLAAIDPVRFRSLVGGALEVMIQPLDLTQGGVQFTEVSAGPVVRDLILTPGGTGHRVQVKAWPAPNDSLKGDVLVMVGSDSPQGSLRDALDHWPGPKVLIQPLGAVPVDSRRHSTYVGYTWGYNRTLVAERVQDVLTTLTFLEQEHPNLRVVLAGLGPSAPVITIAAALASTPLSQVIIEGGWDFDQIDRIDHENMLPRAMRTGGLSSFAALLSPTPLHWLGSVPKCAQALYHAEGAPKPLAVDTPEELAELFSRLGR